MSKYTLFTQTIEFKVCNEQFFDIQYQVWRSLDASSAEFNKWYDSCGDILTVLKGYEKKATELVIKHSNKKLFAELPQLEIYDISEDSYDDECLVFSESIDALDEVADAYNSIIAQQEAEEEYRAERKANRGRVVGGGFGVGGALKGMATAGTMNAISGAGHSLVNAIGNIGSAMEASSAKRALYNNSSTKATLRKGIREDVLACYNAHIHLINERKGNYYVSCFDSDKAGALFENAKKVAQKRVELLLDAFKNCPWNEDLLSYIFSEYKEERKNVWVIAKRFHVDLHQVAEDCFSKMYTGNARNSEDAAQAVKQDILTQMKELGITVSGTIDRIERDGVSRILSGYDTAKDQARNEMFDKLDAYDATEQNKAVIIHNKGVWELAKKYHVSFSTEEVEKILSAAYIPAAKNNEAEAQKAKTRIKTIMLALNVKDSATFNALECDCIQRLCPNYQTADEATCNSMLKSIEAYDALEKNKSKFIHGIRARIEAIWSAEDGEIFDNVYLNTDIHNAEQIEKSVQFVQSKKRTASGNKYLSALKTCNEENIKKAQQFQQSSTKLAMYIGVGAVILGIILLIADLGLVLSLAVAAIGAILLVYYNNLKKVWDVLTLNGTLVHAMLSITGAEKKAPPKQSPEDAAAKIDQDAKLLVEIEEMEKQMSEVNKDAQN